jgi:hypothetical protein
MDMSICADCGGNFPNWLLLGIACVVAVTLFIVGKRLARRSGVAATAGSIALYACSVICLVVALLA